MYTFSNLENALASRSYTYTKGSLTATTKTSPASLSFGWLIYPGICELEHDGPPLNQYFESKLEHHGQVFVITTEIMNLLNAAGTPIIRALPLICSLRLTLFPGESSTRTSRLGMLSPTLTNCLGEIWRERQWEALIASPRMTLDDGLMIDSLVNDLGWYRCRFCWCQDWQYKLTELFWLLQGTCRGELLNAVVICHTSS